MSFTTKHLEAVEAAIARGEKVVRYADRTVEYRDVDDLLRAREEIRSSLASSGPARPRAFRLQHGGRGI
ncbi:hypothetical protein NJC40_08710 [Pseudomonas sp. 21LCFQ02]|uniref:phage head-tail joining protein n=1 Tax=Pseudomonas sp. 21LCFQ02 TaxID=2957505 RepID=UPI00209A7192|nr:hypothetical protein [Pseudomonas sp. 21LCFQ02]MCO8167858.1 hypothetical protein [Pseudomonas sp. 21LCFQ02]